MITRAFVLFWALFAAGCVSTEPSQTAGCSLLAPKPSDHIFVSNANAEENESLLFDARLISGHITETRSGCLFEGVAPSLKVTEIQARWVEARARAMCAGVPQRRTTPSIAALDQRNHEFALEIVPYDDEASTCEPYLGDAESDGGSGPAPYSTPPPRYPSVAVRQMLEGTTFLLLQIGSDGQVEASIVIRSSGHALLDEEALRTTAGWRFHPAKNAKGEPVGSLISVPIEYNLG